MTLDLIEQHGFDLLEMIDESSLTVAWKARQRTLDRTVVLRILKPGAAAEPAAAAHFLSIARIVSRIKSESIASIFDIVSDGSLHYVVMEHVEGPTLEELVAAGGPLPAERALRIAASLTASLEQLWESARIVHRNLKSGSIRLATRGVPKITDFNLAIPAGPGVNATALDGGSIVGTPCFLSPEQALGAHTLTTQSDMYALGAVLYHLATGAIPFERPDVIAVLAAHVKERLPPPHRLNPAIPASFSLFLRRLMMKAPEDRYPDWQAVLHDIRLLLTGNAPSGGAFPGDSSIEEFGDDPPGGGTLLRLKKPAGSGRFAARGSEAIQAGRDREARRAKQLACWLALAVWLAGLAWFRAARQETPEPAAGDRRSEIGDQTPEEGTPAPGLGARTASSAEEAAARPEPEPAAPVADEPSAPPASVPVPPPPVPSGIPAELAARLARAFADGALPAAREAVRSAPARFQEKDELSTLLDSVPEPDALVADYLRARIGKPLIFERNDKQRTVVPREVTDTAVRVEANGRGIDIQFRDLSPDEKLRWMERPKDAPQSAAYCLTLMKSSRRDELPARAAACPLLAQVLADAAALTPAR